MRKGGRCEVKVTAAMLQLQRGNARAPPWRSFRYCRPSRCLAFGRRPLSKSTSVRILLLGAVSGRTRGPSTDRGASLFLFRHGGLVNSPTT
jgi:hypothetical protein